MTARDNKFFNVSQKYEMDFVCKKYENPDAVREFIKEKAAEGIIKYWTHDKLYAFLAESGFKRHAKADKLGMEGFAKQIQERTGMTLSDAHKLIMAFVECLNESIIDGNPAALQGFGSFRIVQQSARTGRNPQNGELIEIPAKKVVKFVPAKVLKDAVAGKE